MPNRDDSESTDANILTFVAQVLTQHEKQMDRLISKLQATKEELSKKMEKIDSNLDSAEKKLDALESKIKELQRLLPT